jgi:hypothetical protein
MYSYPENDWQQPQRLRQMLGSLWHRLYDGRDFILDKVQGVGELYTQLLSDLQETAAAVSRQTVPVFHRENWHFLTLKQSELNNNQAALWRLDRGEQLDQGLKFDSALGIDYTFDLPENLRDVNLIMNRLTDPSVVLHKNMDFQLDLEAGGIVFRENPFENADIPQTPIFVNGEITDYQITLALFRGQFDTQQIYTQFGYVLDLYRPSSAEYRSLVNAVFDAVTGCTAKQQLEDLVSLMADIPLVREAEETVEQITTDANFTWVITDKNAYAFSTAATVTVAVTDVVRAGDTLTTGIEKIEFRHGELNSAIRCLVLGKGFLAPGFVGELIFVNSEQPITIEDDHVSFPIGGFPGDVARFWELVRAQELARDQLLYDLLRAQGNLPTTVNPAKFLVANVLRNNCVAYRLAVSDFGAKPIDHNPEDLLRRIVPPRSAVMLLFELSPLSQSVNITDAAVTPFDMTYVLRQNVGSSEVNDSYMTIKLVNYHCY